MHRSDKDGLCDAVIANELRAGETLLQAYELVGTGTGTYTPSPDQAIKYARLMAGCSGGPNAEDNSDVSSRATAVPTITTTDIIDAAVSGTVVATFEDGSTSNVSFTVAVCSTSTPENALCE